MLGQPGRDGHLKHDAAAIASSASHMDRQSDKSTTARALSPGLLIVGHGTRCKVGRAEFHQTVQRVKAADPQLKVAAGFLEGGEPTIASAWHQLVAGGVRRVVVAPLLLFAAGHARTDIPSILDRLAAGSPSVQIEQLPPLGRDPALVQLSVARYQRAIEACTAAATAPAPRTRLLFVARGASDPRARHDAREYGKAVAAAVSAHDHLTCFLAVGQPSLDEALAATAAEPFDRVVVIPHLLFAGRLLQRVRDQVSQQDQGSQRQQWLMGDHLGPDPVVAQAIVRRFSLATAPPRVRP
jgi:sirohydrochlorin ferrochelatase